MVCIATQGKPGVIGSAMVRDDIVGEDADEVCVTPDLTNEGAGDMRGKGRERSYLRKTGQGRGEHQPYCVYILG